MRMFYVDSSNLRYKQFYSLGKRSVTIVSLAQRSSWLQRLEDRDTSSQALSRGKFHTSSVGRFAHDGYDVGACLARLTKQSAVSLHFSKYEYHLHSSTVKSIYTCTRASQVFLRKVRA